MTDNNRKVYIAVDLGATSGRVIAGVWSDGKLELVEKHRFETPSVLLRGRWYWDFLSLYSEILYGIKSVVDSYGAAAVSIGVDTWGVDYGLLDEKGELLANPVCYRDSRTAKPFEYLAKELGKDLIYSETGIQFMFFNTLYQMGAEVAENRTAFRSAKRILFLPDLVNYWLSGVQGTERSIASTTQMLNPHTGDWSVPILQHLGVEPDFLGEIVEPGTKLGPVTKEVASAIGAAELSVTTVAGHDTGSAFMALPEVQPNYGILSSGTWSILGFELEEPNTSQAAAEAGFSNEVGYGGTIRFLKNICGLWLLEECRRTWLANGEEASYATIVEEAAKCEPMRSLIDPDYDAFATAGDMPEKIRAFCRERGEPEPQTNAQMARCIFDSLALKYDYVFSVLEKVTGKSLEGLFILGGGSRNDLVNQLAADALGLPVVVGAAEATAVGNVMAQMIADGVAANLAEARELVAPSFSPRRFTPREGAVTSAVKARFSALIA
ncbi:rhamnulokinase family protein [Pelagicoccus sp. SDUM812005]|uniref:rhamnulokinase n=1 Tax=Pelagicoccus sp. SDUM812005 TaxID=3041257 RepID=UPI00280CCD76|nr:rhamnulokinase family protein [Pelagicoccus sp. SDUM812005]MDQ8179626.1 rhamnulokinase [Pelagicoccus sp. SDUM812005]